MPINRDLCRLMTEEHIRAFDTLEAQFCRIEQALPQLWSRKETKDLVARLAKLKEQIERPRYYVGFLGRSQVGKSSTLNSILKAPVATGGAGAPMTSTVTRIFRINPGNGSGHQVVLKFMTPEQFRQRRGKLCRYLDLNPQEPDDVILAMLDKLLKQEHDDSHSDSRTTSAKTEDRRYLARLLRSYRKYSHFLSDPPRTERGEYDKRKDYTNHPKDQDSWPYLLLSEVEIGYQTEAISPKIELIDLPGLGARLFSDDLLTQTFLPRLDGALVFQSSEQVAAKEAYDLLEKLSERFRRMDGRVWMVFTRFDGLSKDHLGSAPDAVNILDNIAKTLADNGVPHEQVLFVGTEFHRKLLEGNGQVRKPDLVKAVLNLDCDDKGQAILPVGFKRHPVLCEAFAEVIRDGGIDNLRKIIGDRLAALVEVEVREAVETDLRSLKADLRRLVRSAEESSRLNSGGFRRAVHWRVKLQTTQQQVERDREVIEVPTKEVIKRLQDEFCTDLFPENFKVPRGKLRTTHQEYATVLTESAALVYKTDLVPRVYDWITERLRQSHATLGDVALNGHSNPLKAWEDLKDKDLDSLNWLGPVLTFDQPLLFPPEDDIHLNDRQYREVVLKKVECLCHRAALKILERVKCHLEDLQSSLTLMQTAENRVDNAAPAVFQEILSQLA